MLLQLQKFFSDASSVVYVVLSIIVFLGSAIVTLVIAIIKMKNKELNGMLRRIWAELKFQRAETRELRNDLEDLQKIVYLNQGRHEK